MMTIQEEITHKIPTSMIWKIIYQRIKNDFNKDIHRSIRKQRESQKIEFNESQSNKIKKNK